MEQCWPLDSIKPLATCPFATTPLLHPPRFLGKNCPVRRWQQEPTGNPYLLKMYFWNLAVGFKPFVHTGFNCMECCEIPHLPFVPLLGCIPNKKTRVISQIEIHVFFLSSQGACYYKCKSSELLMWELLTRLHGIWCWAGHMMTFAYGAGSTKSHVHKNDSSTGHCSEMSMDFFWTAKHSMVD